MTQRFIELVQNPTDPDGFILSVNAPPNGTIAPPGWYMIFIVSHGGTCEGDHEDCDNRIPSIAKWIRLS